MAYTTVKISPAKLVAVLKEQRLSKADFERMLDEGSRESVLKWTNERKRVVGVKPAYFRDIIKKLGIEAAVIEVASGTVVPDPYAELEALAARHGLTPDQVVQHFRKLVNGSAPGIPAEGEKKLKLAAHKPQKGKGTGGKPSEPPPDPDKPLK